MTTTVLADNTVKIPDALARVMGLTPGAAWDRQVAENGTLLLRVHPDTVAACAKVHKAVLVHRDPHLAQVPAHLLRQEPLPPKT